MKIVIQRVKRASVSVEGCVKGSIQSGMLLLLGFSNQDTDKYLDQSIQKLLALRIFQDDQDRMNLSVVDAKKQILVVSQFTLYADVKKGNRPSFINCMKSEEALKLYELWMQKIKRIFPDVQDGEFGADMQIEALLDGPITINLEY